MHWVDYIPQETVFWRRRLWDRTGGAMDESLRFAVDWELLLRFADAGARFARIPQFIAAFRVHQNQKTQTEMASVGKSEVDEILERYHGYLPSSSEIDRKVAGYQMKHHLYDLAYSLGLLPY